MTISENAQQCQLFADYKFIEDKMPDTWEEKLTGTATSIWDDDSYVEMKALVQNDRAVRQTKQYFPVHTGKYKKCLFTMVMNTISDTGYTCRVGNFDDHTDKTVLAGDIGGAGIFFEYKDNVMYAGIRYGTTDNGTDTLVSQTNFNVNDLSRNSHIRLTNWTQIYTFEVKFNNIGYVEWAIYLDGERILLHREQDLTRILNTLPNFNLPLRAEITKTANDAGATTGEMRQFNTSLYYEQDYEIPVNNSDSIGVLKCLDAISNDLYTIDDFNYKPIFSFRLKEAHIRKPILIYDILYLVHKKAPFMYKIIRNGTPNNITWVDPGADYRLEYDVSSDDLSSYADCIRCEYVDADATGGTAHYLAKTFDIRPSILSSDIEGNADVFTLVVRKMSHQKVTANFMLSWVEQS